MDTIKFGIYKIGSLFLVMLLSNFSLIAQDFAPWPVPDEAAAVQNPVEFDKESIQAGRSLYNLQCKSCHGETGKGDGLIKAASLTSEEFQLESDGAVMWRLLEGRGQMPSFKALPEEDRWNVINYVRSFTKKRDGVVMKNAVVSLFFNEKGEQKELTAKVMEVADDSTKTPATGIKVNFGVQRAFGIMQISNSLNYTNEQGEVTAIFPNKLIGDENGILIVSASIEDMDFNPADAREEISWGQANPNDYWSERRALWKNNEHVPVWLLFTFIGGAMGIWLVIMYVALLVRKIKVEGDKIK